MAIHARCISIISHFWNIPKGHTAVGTATTGSSEAIHLGGLAMKRRWQASRRAAGKDTSNPNIIMGSNAQVALEKFARYFEVEARILPVSVESHYCLDSKLVKQNLDENTIGVFVIMGSTYTGHFEPVEEISKILDEYEAETGHSVPIHVDAASGGFVAPFTEHTNGKWSFDVPRVNSINVSGHKYGLVYPGLGWVLWKDESYLPKELIFELHYLGGTEQTYTLNFSRPGAHVVAQYFNFLHLGKGGYRRVMQNALYNARRLSWALEETGWYTCVSDIHRKRGVFVTESESETTTDTSDTDKASRVVSLIEGVKNITPGTTNPPTHTHTHRRRANSDDLTEYNPGLPVVSFRFSDSFRKAHPNIRQSSVSTLLRTKGYIIPNYSLPPNLSGTEILRVVIRVSMGADLLDRLITDIIATTETLISAHEEAVKDLGAKVDLLAFGGISGEPVGGATDEGKVVGRKGADQDKRTVGRHRGMSISVEREFGSLGAKAGKKIAEGLQGLQHTEVEGEGVVEGAERGLLRSTC